MPVHSVKQLRNNTVLILWEITESSDQLREMIDARLLDWHASERSHENKHWLASRLAILNHFRNEEVEIRKDAYNKPHLRVDDQPVHLSITHSFEMAGVIINPDHPVSMDLERIDARIDRVKHKFCNPQELQGALAGANPTLSLTLIWAAKETLYKWYGKKELDFREHLFVEPITVNGEWFTITGWIRKDDYSSQLQLRAQLLGHYVMVYID